MIALSGEGVAPAVTLPPGGFDFGATEIGAKSVARPSPYATTAARRSPSARPRSSAPTPTSSRSPATNAAAQRSRPGRNACCASASPPTAPAPRPRRCEWIGEAGAFTASLAGLGGTSQLSRRHGANAGAWSRWRLSRRASAAPPPFPSRRLGQLCARSAAAVDPHALPPASRPLRYRRPVIGAVLFDIDGTLLVTGGAGAVAWQRAFRELHGVDANIEEHTHAGMTDPEIAAIVFREVIGRDGTDREQAEAIAGYLGHLAEAVAESAGYRVMPGIEELLPRLAEHGVLLGIVTGNIESAAHIKLARADLNRFFAFGGYGSDSRDRTELTKKALERGGDVSGPPSTDDADRRRRHPPRRQGRPRRRHPVVGVATGSYSVEEQNAAGRLGDLRISISGLIEPVKDAGSECALHRAPEEVNAPSGGQQRAW